MKYPQNIIIIILIIMFETSILKVSLGPPSIYYDTIFEVKGDPHIFKAHGISKFQCHHAAMIV